MLGEGLAGEGALATVAPAQDVTRDNALLRWLLPARLRRQNGDDAAAQIE